MASILNDKDIKQILDSIIIGGDEGCIRPNSYVLRLGSVGEFLNTGKEFELGDIKKGIKLKPGQAIALTAFEKLDFRRKTVHKIFPDNDLHGLLSPTTDLSREGIVAASTQVDAGFTGTLNWTLSNTSNEERRFVYKEKLFRLTIFKLEKGEIPENLYDGDYQSKNGYVRSQRPGAPAGMKEAEWEDGHIKGGPEDLLEDLIKSGYPWHILGERLKVIDQQLKSVTTEYSDINDSIGKITRNIDQIQERQSNTSETVRKVLREEASSLQDRWLIGTGSLIFIIVGAALTIISNETVLGFFQNNAIAIGIIFIVAAFVGLFLISRKK